MYSEIVAFLERGSIFLQSSPVEKEFMYWGNKFFCGRVVFHQWRASSVYYMYTFSLFLHKSICFRYSLKSSWWGISSEHYNIHFQRREKNYYCIRWGKGVCQFFFCFFVAHFFSNSPLFLSFLSSTSSSVYFPPFSGGSQNQPQGLSGHLTRTLRNKNEQCYG